MPCRPPRQIIKINEEDRGASGNSLPTITTVPDLADHSLGEFPKLLQYLVLFRRNSIKLHFTVNTSLSFKCISMYIMTGMILVMCQTSKAKLII